MAPEVSDSERSHFSTRDWDRRELVPVREEENDTDVKMEAHDVDHDDPNDPFGKEEHQHSVGAAIALELVICILQSIVFAPSTAKVLIFWGVLWCACIVRAMLWVLKSNGNPWGTRLLLPLYFAPCGIYALTVDQMLIQYCHVDLTLVNVTTFTEGPVGYYPRCYVRCRDRKNGSMTEHLMEQLTDGSAGSRALHIHQDLSSIASLECLCMSLKYGVPVLFGYVFVKGVMKRALRNPDEAQSVFHNVRLFVLDIADIMGFSTHSFDATAHIWFSGNWWWANAKFGLVLTAWIAAFAEVLLGLQLKAEGWRVSKGGSEDEEESLESLSFEEREERLLLRHLEGKACITFLSLFFIDVPFSCIRFYFLTCGVPVQKFYLLKNVVCIIYGVTRFGGCIRLHKAMDAVMAALPGVAKVELEVTKQHAYRADKELKHLKNSSLRAEHRIYDNYTGTSQPRHRDRDSAQPSNGRGVGFWSEARRAAGQRLI